MPRVVTGGSGAKTYDGTTVADVQDLLDHGARGIGETLLRHSGEAILGAGSARLCMWFLIQKWSP